MSASREKKKRYNQKLEYIAAYNKWLSQEPPAWKFIQHRRWKKLKPEKKWD